MINKLSSLSYLAGWIITSLWLYTEEILAFEFFQQPSLLVVGKYQRSSRQYSSTQLDFRGQPIHSRSYIAGYSKIRMPASTNPEPSSPTPTPGGGGMFRAVFNAIGSTTSIVVSGTFFGVLAYQRDDLMVSFFIGSISNAIMGKVLKNFFNQERPQDLDTANLVVKPSDGGMPSSHAMSLGFIGTFTGLTLPWTQVPIILYSAISLAYRVTTKLHTWQQIVVGFALGSTDGAIWRHLCDGRNPFHINIMDVVSSTVLNDAGVLPWLFLAVPALVGLVVVGSVERQIAGWLKKIKGE